MPINQTLVQQARALGQAIAAEPCVKAHVQSQQAIQADTDAQKLLREYNEHMQRMRTLESTGKPIEPSDKHKLADFEAALASNDLVKQLMRTQADYIELMNAVNNAMSEPMSKPQADQ
ncbi:MAG: YlbF family regulator [Phycisphaerae bacterium]|nr:YlbF family regulator [Phycisphaerae bacterium]